MSDYLVSDYFIHPTETLSSVMGWTFNLDVIKSIFPNINLNALILYSLMKRYINERRYGRRAEEEVFDIECWRDGEDVRKMLAEIFAFRDVGSILRIIDFEKNLLTCIEERDRYSERDKYIFVRYWCLGQYRGVYYSEDELVNEIAILFDENPCRVEYLIVKTTKKIVTDNIFVAI